MKIAIISDAHIPHWSERWSLLARSIRASIEEAKPDLLIDAGDMMADAEGMARLQSEWSVPIISVRGNHDYYHKNWLGPERDCKLHETGGRRIAAATLWVDFNRNNPLTHAVVARSLNDFRLIGNFTTETAFAAHVQQKRFLQDTFANGVDIVVTHHCPSFRSVHKKYRTASNEHINYGFASHLDELVEASGAKLWIHGHTHTPCDYAIGKTRVICNPLGYPGEYAGAYRPVYVEV
jgi:predicted phosphodiesterase